MAIWDLFSKRERRRRGDVPDVYTYDDIPSSLRVQIVHIMQDAFGTSRRRSAKAAAAYRDLHDGLAREYGVFELSKGAREYGDHEEALVNFFLAATPDKAIDVVEMICLFIVRVTSDWHYRQDAEPLVEPDAAIMELNQRFREHAIGYQFEGSELVRVDSQLLHDSAVRPALAVLRGKVYAGANQEFLAAHEHYRKGRYKESVIYCLKAFESTMKAICQKQQWPYSPNATVSGLIDVCLRHGLISTTLQSQFSALRATLESGIPTIRNKRAAHGQGTQISPVPDYLAAYLLHLTASTILLFAEAEKAL